MTFEQIINEATLVADARTKTAKDFKKHCIEVAIPQILKAHKALGYSHLFIYHDTRLFTGTEELTSGDYTEKYCSCFSLESDTIIATIATELNYNFEYCGQEQIELGKLTFYGLLDCLPRMLAKLERATKEVQEKLEKANLLMNV